MKNINRILLVGCLMMTALLVISCKPATIEEETQAPIIERDYRQDMRDFVQVISAYAKGIKPGFIVIPQNGHILLTENGEVTGVPALAYMKAIDGIGREDLFYG